VNCGEFIVHEIHNKLNKWSLSYREKKAKYGGCDENRWIWYRISTVEKIPRHPRTTKAKTRLNWTLKYNHDDGITQGGVKK